MKLGRVINNVWATRKDEGLIGVKLLIVQLFDGPKEKPGAVIVAADLIGAGIGEKVLVTEGSSARQVGGQESKAIDAIIVAIIDEKKQPDVGVKENA